jgi:hypothetical protein
LNAKVEFFIFNKCKWQVRLILLDEYVIQICEILYRQLHHLRVKH